MKNKSTVFKYLFDIIIIIASAIVITLGLLVMVVLFEKYGIHVAGSREMWFGLIGAILGGAYTLLGVQITIRMQKEADIERKRIECMPILQFSTKNQCNKCFKGEGTFTLSGNEFFTTGFPKDELKLYPIIEISLASVNPAFNVRIDSCITAEHKKTPVKTEFYFPQEYRLVSNDRISNMFCIEDYESYSYCNICGILRISYYDVFENPYYQDISFTYNEKVSLGYNILQINRVLPPILADKKAPSLLQRVRKEYPYLYEEKAE